MQNIIINADDFGMSKEITSAILSAMDQNLCLDTTLLVNFGDAERAANLAIDTNKKDNIGIHFNLTEGIPLTDKIKQEKRFCNDEGIFHYKKQERIMALTSSEKTAVFEELSSQVHLCRSFGIPVSHADSHNHVHEEPGLFLVFLNVIRKEKIPFLRITNNIGATSITNKLYRKAYNTALALYNLDGTHYFGTTTEFVAFPKTNDTKTITEIMIHPGAIINDEIIDTYSKENLSLNLPEIIKGNNLISYHQLIK